MAVILGLTFALGIGLALILSVASELLKVEEDPRLQDIVDLLPNQNCGLCGNPGCKAMAQAILNEESKLSQCKPGNQEMRDEIAEYLQFTPNEEGEYVKVKM